MATRSPRPRSEASARANTVPELTDEGMALDMFRSPDPWPVVAAATEANLSTIGPPMPATPPDPDTWIAALGSLPLLAQPGERWLYNTGAAVLGVLCARAAGMPYPDVL